MRPIALLLNLSIICFFFMVNAKNTITDNYQISIQSDMFTKNSNDLSPIEDYNKLSKMIFKTANLAFKIAKDKVITNKEAIKYNKMARQITEFESELKQKYENDEESLKLIEEYKVCNSEEIEKMNSYNMMSFMALYECEGVDKLY